MPLPMYDSSPKIKNIIAIAAGKGGVGKSTITVNLALTLQHLGYKVGILDADLYGPSLRKMLLEETLPVQKDNKLIPALCNQIPIISFAFFRREDEAAAMRAPIANNIINQFLNNVEWGSLDYLLIDFPPGTGDIQMTLGQKGNLSGAIVVTTPQEVSVIDVKKAIHLFEQLNIPLIGVVENMSYYYEKASDKKVYIFGKEGGTNLAKESKVPFLGEIPLDPLICQFADQGSSLFKSENEELKNHFIHFTKNFLNSLEAIKTSDNSSQEFNLVWKNMDVE